MADAKLAVRDQFIEGINDTSLRRELRRMVKEKPESTLQDVREVAIAWSLEEKRSNPRLIKNRQVSCDDINAEGHCSLISQDRPSTTLEDIVRVVSEQSKAIGELTIALKESLIKKENPNQGPPRKFKLRPQYTDDGKPICFKCRGEGHVAKECMNRKSAGQSSVQTTPTQGN